MASGAHLLLAGVFLALSAWGIALVRRAPSVPLLFVLVPVAFLVYDNVVIGLGAYTGTGSTLEGLNEVRFVAHAGLTPLWIVSVAALLRAAGVEWSERPWCRVGAWVLAGAAAATGILADIGLELEPKRFAGSLRYVAVDPRPPVGALVTTIAVLVAGIALLRRHRWPWLLLAAVALVVAAGADGPSGGVLAANTGEALLSAALLAAFARWVVPRPAGAGATDSFHSAGLPSPVP